MQWTTRILPTSLNPPMEAYQLTVTHQGAFPEVEHIGSNVPDHTPSSSSHSISARCGLYVFMVALPGLYTVSGGFLLAVHLYASIKWKTIHELWGKQCDGGQTKMNNTVYSLAGSAAHGSREKRRAQETTSLYHTHNGCPSSLFLSPQQSLPQR